ncbi:MAG TPA: hypothetical protein VKP30_23415 [Polyangiaceae bacterium]|nr:hypothetical protein [Polyangiaceae bacterium]
MRVWPQRRLIALLVVGSFQLVVACGGSASETPEPIRPDSWQFKLRHQRLLSTANQTDASRATDRDESFERSAPARSTWGATSSDGAKPELLGPGL